jgi:hypothetical protein
MSNAAVNFEWIGDQYSETGVGNFSLGGETISIPFGKFETAFKLARLIEKECVAREVIAVSRARVAVVNAMNNL